MPSDCHWNEKIAVQTRRKAHNLKVAGSVRDESLKLEECWGENPVCFPRLLLFSSFSVSRDLAALRINVVSRGGSSFGHFRSFDDKINLHDAI